MRLSLFARTLLILLVGLLVAQLVSLWLYTSERERAVTQTRGQGVIDRIAEAIRILDQEGDRERSMTLKALESDDLRFSRIEASQAFSQIPHGGRGARLQARLGETIEVRLPGGMGGSPMGRRLDAIHHIDFKLSRGEWIRASIGRDPAVPDLPTELLIQLGVSLVIILGVVMFAVRQATRPLRQLAEAADSLGVNLNIPPLPEKGPTEMRQAAHAFNRMQRRILRLVNERARALAAVSHDLRTPLTRLRLRAELVNDEKLRQQIAHDIESMSAMIEGTLSYLRNLEDNEPIRAIDINALLQSLLDDALALGQHIVLTGRASAPFYGRWTALRRALQNLIDNAIRYGEGAHLSIVDTEASLLLMVEDEGPGIPEHALSEVLEPYYRLDSARSQETGGVGLGLSIVRDIANQHGGSLQLANRPQGGLVATLILPRGIIHETASAVEARD